MKDELSGILKDDIAKKVLTFFYQNQTSFDSIGGISAWVQSDREKVHSILSKYVELGGLEKDGDGYMKGYCYTRDKKIMKIVKTKINGIKYIQEYKK